MPTTFSRDGPSRPGPSGDHQDRQEHCQAIPVAFKGPFSRCVMGFVVERLAAPEMSTSWSQNLWL